MRLLCVSMNAIKYHEWHFFLRNKNWGQKAIRGQINKKKVSEWSSPCVHKWSDKN